MFLRIELNKLEKKKKKMEAAKPHVLCVPAPAQGHIKAMLDLAKLLHLRGFHVTFVNTEFNHRRFLKSRGPRSLDGLEGFRFEAVSDGLPSSEAEVTQEAGDQLEISRRGMLGPLRDLVGRLNGSSSSLGVPPVSWIVSDGLLLVVPVVGEEFGIPVAVYFSISACALMSFKELGALRDKGLTPLKDVSYLTNGYLDTIIDWIPGMKQIRLRDLPSFVRTTDPNDPIFNFSIELIEKTFKSSSTVIVHTFNALEADVLEALSSIFSKVYPIGPLPLLVPKVTQGTSLSSIGHSLWKEDNECLNWLNSWPPSSVLYVNFGSITVMTPSQLLEFGHGLASSKHPFLWIIRPDLVVGENAFSPEFAEDTKDRSMVVSWCAQEKVLNHPSVGGFLTHCGWNSTIESISAGVPMLCWPFLGDQTTNCRFICKEWGIGMEIDSEAKRGEVERVVRGLMEGEEGEKMRSRAMEWKRKAEEAVGEHGSSCVALNKLVDQVLLKRH